MEFIDKIQQFLIETADFAKVGPHASPALFVIVVSAALIIVCGLIALGFRASSKGNKIKKHLEDTTAYLEATGEIDVDNVEGLNEKIQDKNMPNTVKRGWGNFLEQQTGYPSDYISEAETFGDKKTNSDFKGGNGFVTGMGVLISLIAAAVGAVGYWDRVANTNLEDLGNDFILGVCQMILPFLFCLVVPLGVTLVVGAVIKGLNSSLRKKTIAAFRKFTETLDANVVIFREPENEFIAENIEEINAAIDDIIAGKLGDSEIMEIVTPPAVPEESVVEEAPAPAPLPVEEAAAAEEAVAPAEEPAPAEEAPTLTPEAKARLDALLQLVRICDSASMDPNITIEQLEEIAIYLDNTKDDPRYDFQPVEIEYLMRCYFILQARYFEMIGRPDLIKPID